MMLLVCLIIFFFLILNYWIRRCAGKILCFFNCLRRCLGSLRERIRFYRIFFGDFYRNSGFLMWWGFTKLRYTLFTCDWIWLWPIGTGTPFLWGFFRGLRRSPTDWRTFTLEFINLLFLSTGYHCCCHVLVFLGDLFHQLLGLTHCFRSIVCCDRKAILLESH